MNLPFGKKIELNILLLLAFSLPIFSAIRIAGFSVSRLLVIIYIVVCLISFSISKNVKTIDFSLLVSCFIYIGWMMISLLWTPNSDVIQGIATTSVQQGIIRIFFSLCCVMLFCFVASSSMTNDECHKIENALLFGGIISAIMLFIIGGDYYGEQGEARYSITEGADPNYYAMNLLVPLAISLKNIEGKKITKWLPTFLLFAAIIATGSRGALIAVAVIMFMKLIHERKYLLLIASIIIIFLLLTSLAVIYPRFALESAMNGSGRADIWTVILSMIEDNLFTGVGVSGIRGVYDMYAIQSGVGQAVGNQRDAHNAYLEIFAELGLVGITSYLYIIYRSFKIHYKQYKKFVHLSIGVIGCLVCVAAISSILEETIWFCLALLAIRRDNR